MLAPPAWWLVPPVWEILDPPLLSYPSESCSHYKTLTLSKPPPMTYHTLSYRQGGCRGWGYGLFTLSVRLFFPILSPIKICRMIPIYSFFHYIDVCDRIQYRKEMGAEPIHIRKKIGIRIRIGAVCHLLLCCIPPNELERKSESEKKIGRAMWTDRYRDGDRVMMFSLARSSRKIEARWTSYLSGVNCLVLPDWSFPRNTGWN